MSISRNECRVRVDSRTPIRCGKSLRTLEDEISQIVSRIARAQSIATGLGLEPEFDDLLSRAMSIRTVVAARVAVSRGAIDTAAE
jgi:hypothetical protein